MSAIALPGEGGRRLCVGLGGVREPVDRRVEGGACVRCGLMVGGEDGGAVGMKWRLSRQGIWITRLIAHVGVAF